jgi:hypothetical protein
MATHIALQPPFQIRPGAADAVNSLLPPIFVQHRVVIGRKFSRPRRQMMHAQQPPFALPKRLNRHRAVPQSQRPIQLVHRADQQRRQPRNLQRQRFNRYAENPAPSGSNPHCLQARLNSLSINSTCAGVGASSNPVHCALGDSVIVVIAQLAARPAADSRCLGSSLSIAELIRRPTELFGPVDRSEYSSPTRPDETIPPDAPHQSAAYRLAHRSTCAPWRRISGNGTRIERTAVRLSSAASDSQRFDFEFPPHPAR